MGQVKDWNIYSVDLGMPFGSEQGQVRSAVAVKLVNGICIIIPMTKTLLNLERFSYTSRIKSDNKNNLNSDGVALVFQIRAIDLRRIGSEIGVLDQTYIDMLKAQIKDMFKI